VPNGTGGIRITAAGNLIGGDTRRNTIAFNNGPGIAVSGSFSTAIRENAIFANAGLGIDLGDDGVTTNDGTDEADGIQNAPVLFLATTTAGGVRVQGSFSSTPGVGYDVVFYSSASCDPSGFGEGETPVGITLDNSTDLSGNMSIDINLGAVAVGRFITAVARDRDLNRSSEFSNCVEVTPFGIVEWTSFADGNGNYYEYVLDGGLSWDAARDAAAARTFKGIQGRLVSITTSSENFFVNRLRFFHNQQDMRAWVGLFDASGTGAYSWLGGEAMTYTNWSVGEPTTGGLERWVEMFADGTWNNNVQRDPIFPTFGYVVEYARAR
jgi:hypothetical protein